MNELNCVEKECKTRDVMVGTWQGKGGGKREVRVRNGHWDGSLSSSCPPLLLSFLRFEAKGEGKSVLPTNRPTNRPV